MRGLRAVRSNFKDCSFRKQLLQYCREQFEALLVTPLTEEKKENESEDDR